MQYPPPYIIEPADGAAHTHTVVLLHGRSSTAEEFANDLLSLRTSEPATNLSTRFPGIRWVFPDAGLRWCTIFKAERSAWFDMVSLDNMSERQDLQIPGLRYGVRLVNSVVESEVERLNGEACRLVLGGFSQGSATVLWSLFTGAAMTKGRLGAFMGLSAWMPFTNEAMAIMERQSGKALRNRNGDLMDAFTTVLSVGALVSAETMEECLQIPVYLGHGADDNLVNVSNCHDLAIILRKAGARAEIQEYIGADREGHWIKAPAQVEDMVDFLVRVLGID